MAEQQQPYYNAQPQRSRWRTPIWIMLALVGGMFLGVLLLGVGFASFIGGMASKFGDNEAKIEIKDNSILYLNFEGGVKEFVHKDGGPFGGEKSGVKLLDVLTAIKYAKNDPNIKGIYYKPTGTAGFAKQREIISAMEDFKRSGKFIYAFLPSGGEKEYYFAALADSIFMPQEAMFEFNGFGSTTAFLKNMFDKLGVEWTVIQREEYKSAGEMYNRTGFSEPARQEIQELLNQRTTLFVNDIARFRKKTPEQISALMARGVYSPDSLKAFGLIDAFATDLQIKEFLKKKMYGSEGSDKKLRMVSIKDYAVYARNEMRGNLDKDNKIAIVYGSGAIRSGRTSGTGEEIASGSYIRELRKAADDDEIKAIILRIDSPGGSVQASDEIYQEILRAKKKKPVYASMSDVAASGGYYMAMSCDTIVAHEETITGSIGVIASIPNFWKTCANWGISIDSVTSNKGALFMDPGLPLSPQDKEKVESMIQSMYMRFLERVASGRKSTPEKIREVAKGRVWTGTAAKERGLVDVNGGLYTTIELVKKRLGVPADKGVKIVSYPQKDEGFEALVRYFKSFTNGGDEGEDDDADERHEQQIQSQASINQAIEQFVNMQNPAWKQAWKTMPESVRKQFEYSLTMMAISRNDIYLSALPWYVSIE
jgi:protease IV